MKNYKKEYIECRLIILGDDKVGKKSFINRLLNVSSTTTIRNLELEKSYKKQIFAIRKKYEKQKKYLEMLQGIDEEMNKSPEKNKEKNDKIKKSFSNTDIFFSYKNKDKKVTKKEEDNNNFIMKVTTEDLYYSNKYIRPPIPEHPSKLFNVQKTKICVKPFYILPAEKVSYDYNPSEENSDIESNISLKGIKNDIYKIISNTKTVIEENQLNGYNISIYNMFLFFYDLSDFNTFETIIHYYDSIEDEFELSSLDNSMIYIIGNKRDIKIPLLSEQETIFSKFVKENNIPLFEISTKPYFNFGKFFLEFLLLNLNKYHQELINEFNFESDLEKIIFNKTTFSKTLREIHPRKDSFPGPKYDVNIYSFNSKKELKQSLANQKYRFTKKIFYNKIGPKLASSKSSKDIKSKILSHLLSYKNKFLFEQKEDLMNRPIEGYSFGAKGGKLNLVKERRELFLKRNENLLDSIEGDTSSLFTKKDKSKIKGDEYFDEATERRKKLFEKRVLERRIISDKIAKIHSNNLKKMIKDELMKKKMIILSHNNKTFSSPNILENKNNSIEKKENNEKRNLDSLATKNESYLKKYNKILKIIKLNKKEDITPGPNAYDIRNNYTDRSKGPTIAGKRKEINHSIVDPSYPELKDDFEIIAEKANNYIIKEFKPRFEKIIQEPKKAPYINEEIWKKWKKNKSNLEKKGRIKQFIQNLKMKKNNQLIKMEEIKEQNEEIKNLRRELLMRKGFEDPCGIKSINYSLVEDSSPKYSIKGKSKYYFGQIDINEIDDEDELIINSQLNRPLPDLNKVKPKLPNIVFNKAERFNYNTKEYEGSLDLFKDGNFALKTKENFSHIEPYSLSSRREAVKQKMNNSPSPSPADYKIKSPFEIIVEKGKKISEQRERIKNNEQLGKIKMNMNQEIVNYDDQNKKESESNKGNIGDN